MKTLRTKLDDRLQFDLMMAAHKRASRGKVHRDEILRFNLDLTGNIQRLMELIGSEQYRPSEYRSFIVFEPKVRQILALPYPDRVVHQWVVEEFYLPYFIPRFISDSYACITGRGSHAAVNRAQELMRHMNQQHDGDYYIMKMDISKYFNSIDPDILFSIMAPRISDPKLRRLTGVFIYSDNCQSGIPIGNYTSQQFANIYLNELDQFCKNDLRIKCYLRYMDDFVLLVSSKATAQFLYGVIEQFLWERLRLRLNPKSHYYPAKLGLNFAGYRIYNDYRLLRPRSKHKINSIIRDYEQGIDDVHEFAMRANAWYGHAKHADSYRFTQSKLAGYRDKLPIIFGDD